MSWTDRIEFDDRGLVPAVAQDAETGEVLMLAWADREALDLTARTGFAHFWSRSRERIWKKGETSGDLLFVREIRVDCDADAVLYRVAPAGAACHTGERSCFYRAAPSADSESDVLVPAGDPRPVLDRIDAVVESRHRERPEGAYTTYLFEKGTDKILKKVGEEATETVIAAKNGDPAELRAEAADLLFHLLVLLRDRGVAFADVRAELDRRFGAAPRDGATEDRERPGA
jgi:phosphoribosyl-ATP pyrophosphohydrolase/phosphoribosyl-AMP cyclohydrolase